MKSLNEELVMTQEDKELLLKDLCARLPYGVKCIVTKSRTEEGQKGDVGKIGWASLEGVDCIGNEPFFSEFGNFKPYLIPLSSMTEEQFHELKEITDFKYNRNNLELVEWTKTHKTIEFWLEEVPQYKVVEVFDWLNKNHFDYRCLIERGLAIDATGLNIY